MNKIAEAMHQFLTDEGYRPQYDNDGDINFKHEGSTYLIMFKEDDEDFISLRKMGRIDDFEEDDSLEVYALLNKLNQEYIVGKCYLLNLDETILVFAIEYLGGIEGFQKNFDRFLRIIQQIERDFLEDYSEI